MHATIIGTVTIKEMDAKIIKLFDISIFSCLFVINQSEIVLSDGNKNQ